jgi:hypothetical protein
MKKLLAASIFILAASTFAAGTPDISGQWKIHQSIAGNENDQECTFAVADNKISGSCKSEDKTMSLTGSIDGNKATWQYQTDYNGSPLTLIYTATLDSPDKINGSVDVIPFGVSGDFTATPIKDAAK